MEPTMNVAVFAFNPFQENTYVLTDTATKEAVIVDAGNYSPAEMRRLQQYIADQGIKPVMAVNTHGHVDHILGVEAVKREYGIPFALHGDDRFLVESAPQHGTIYGFRDIEVPQVEIDLKDTPEIVFGKSRLKVIPTPGHTPGHVCLYDEAGKQLFCGDTLFRESIGRTDLPGGDYSWIMKSILERILPLGGDVRILPGHGPESTIGHEALYNPFITEVVNREVNYR